jgi:hypothetical protein
MLRIKSQLPVAIAICLVFQSAQSQSGSGTGKKSATTADSADSKTAQGQDSPSPTPTISAQSYALAYNGLRADAKKVAAKIANHITAGKIIVLDKPTIDDLMALDVAKLEINLLSQQICEIRQGGPGAAAGAGADALSGISSLISATATLLEVLRPNSISLSSDVKIADEMLESEVVSFLSAAKHYTVLLPRVYVPVPQLTVAVLNDVAGGCPYQASDNLAIAFHRLMLSYAETQVLLASASPLKQGEAPAGSLNEGQKDALKTLLSRIDRFRDELEGSQAKQVSKVPTPVPGANQAKPDTAGNGNSTDQSTSRAQTPVNSIAPLIRLMRVQAFWEQDLKQCITSAQNTTPIACYVLYLHVGQASGGILERKWVFHPDWYYFTGGSTVAFSLLTFNTGELVTGGNFTTITTSLKEGQLKREYSTNKRIKDAENIDEHAVENPQ